MDNGERRLDTTSNSSSPGSRGYQNQQNDNDHSGEDKSNEKDRKQRWVRIWVTIQRQFSTIPTHRSICRHFSALSILCPPTMLISSLLIMTTWMDLTGACHRLSLTVQYRINHGFFLTHLQHYCVFLLSHNLISMLEGHVTSILHINCQKEIRTLIVKSKPSWVNDGSFLWKL